MGNHFNQRETDEAELARGRARVNPSVAAMMRRGLDSALANRLRKSGLTLAALKEMDDQSLANLGITVEQMDAIRRGRRSAVPYDNLVEVLWANRATCCVCRNFDRAIIIHHIQPWAESHDHGVANLAVLCLEHHAQAHRTGTLEQNLSKRQLRDFKRRWEKEVRHLDPRAILDATRVDGHHWWWFNHVRLLEMAEHLEIDLTRLPGFARVLSRGWTDDEGQLSARHSLAPYLYVGGDGIVLYQYMRAVAEAVFAHTAIFNLSDDLNPGFLSRVVRAGDLILIQGRHHFRALNRQDRGPGQACAVSRQANGVRVSFTIDKWEAVANSSWSAWLSGTQLAASVTRVAAVERDERLLHLRCTGLAIGSALQGLSTRHYATGAWPQRDFTEDDEIDEFSGNDSCS